MIHIVVTYGSGDRKSGTITDSLIPDKGTALIRAHQELAASSYIAVTRTIETPHDPAGEHGVLTDELSYHPLAIYGRHLITSITTTLSPTSAKDSIVLEQYREMFL
jgi:hypothetical protein